MVRVYAVIVALFLSASLCASSFGATAGACHAPSSYQLYTKLPHEYPAFYHTLKRLWGSHWVEAAKISWAEGGWQSFASNGQYLGTFQCGSWCRSTYGHGSSLSDQAEAAHRYYSDSGWAGWECRSIL